MVKCYVNIPTFVIDGLLFISHTSHGKSLGAHGNHCNGTTLDK